MNNNYIWNKKDGTTLYDEEAKKYMENIKNNTNIICKNIKKKLKNVLKHLSNIDIAKTKELYEAIYDNIDAITNVQCELIILNEYIEKEFELL